MRLKLSEHAEFRRQHRCPDVDMDAELRSLRPLSKKQVATVAKGWPNVFCYAKEKRCRVLVSQSKIICVVGYDGTVVTVIRYSEVQRNAVAIKQHGPTRPAQRLQARQSPS